MGQSKERIGNEESGRIREGEKKEKENGMKVKEGLKERGRRKEG